MQNTPLRVYVGVIVALSAGSLFLVDWSALNELSAEAWTGLLALVILGLVSESLSLRVKVGGNSGSSSITFLPLLTCVLLFGPVPAVMLHAATGAFGEIIVRRSEPIKAIFNIGQYLLSTVVAGLVFQNLGGLPQGPIGTQFDLQVAPLLGFGMVFLAINQGAVALAIAITESMPFRKVLGLVIGRSGANLGYDLLISPFSIGMAFLYLDYGLAGFLLVILPLLFIRTAYLKAFQLQEVSANLLKALVKAIGCAGSVHVWPFAARVNVISSDR